MEAWKLVLDEAAFQRFVSMPATTRRQLLAAFDQLRNNPNGQPDYYSKDSTERTLSVKSARPFIITYWLDAFVSEIRIVEIQKIRF